MGSYKKSYRVGQVNLKLWRDYSQGLTLEEMNTAVHLFLGSVCAEITPEAMADHIALVEKVLGERRRPYALPGKLGKFGQSSHNQGGKK